jgi:UDP-N-acetylmuramate--alanine ligase
MLFDILESAGLQPSIISGAGLVSIIKQGKIGNAKVGSGPWLVIEADESDGSIVEYKPEIGLLLNIDKDHKEIEVLLDIFRTFKENSKRFVVNQSHAMARQFSQNVQQDFSWDDHDAGFKATGFEQEGLSISFKVNNIGFKMALVGKHNMENALAASAIAAQAGVDLQVCSQALSRYEGIYRRHQVLGNRHGAWVIDDFALNPVKCAAAIAACQPIAPKVIACFNLTAMDQPSF